MASGDILFSNLCRMPCCQDLKLMICNDSTHILLDLFVSKLHNGNILVLFLVLH